LPTKTNSKTPDRKGPFPAPSEWQKKVGGAFAAFRPFSFQEKEDEGAIAPSTPGLLLILRFGVRHASIMALRYFVVRPSVGA
jgi:hypothetical protein